MELRIISPQESGFVKEIQWNSEEVKKYVLEKTAQYKGLVFTEAEIKDAKEDRAKLRKFKNAFEDERKRIKRLCMDPYNLFEQQIKEPIAIIEETIRLIDVQIKEVEENKKAQKRKDIEELFKSIGFQSFVTLDSIWDSRWLNATVSMSKIEEQMKSRMYQIGEAVYTISQLSEYSFEAMEVYKNTLDLSSAIREGKRLAEIQRRKAEYEAEQRRKEEERKGEAERQKKTAEEMRCTPAGPDKAEDKVLEKEDSQPKQEPKLHIVDFRVKATLEQLGKLKEFLITNKIQYGPVPKEGE